MLKVEEGGPVQLEIALKEYASIDLWKGTWDAFNPVNDNHIKLEPNAKVKSALDHLTIAINESHELAFNSSDEIVVKKYIRTLNALKPTQVNPDEVFAYVKREKHWTLALCKKIQELISRLNNGQTFQGGTLSRTEMQQFYNRW